MTKGSSAQSQAAQNPGAASAIDGPAFAPDRLTVRGKDLNDLVGSLSYPAAVYHLLTGALPTQAEADQLDAWLLATLRTLTPDQPLAQLARQSARLGAGETGAVVAALALGDRLGLPQTLVTAPLDALGLHAHRESLYYFAIAPALHCYALERSDAEVAQRQRLLAEATGFVDAIFVLVSGRTLPDARSLYLFHATLVAFHAGLGSHAPTIALPRGAISTRASTAMALAAGYTAAGPAHVGACKMVMSDFAQIVAAAPSANAAELAAAARAHLDSALAAGQRIAGFGHPLFRQDPRNPHLRDLIRQQGLESPYLVVYDTVAAAMHEVRAIHPNIDAIAAALLLALGIPPAYGTALFLCARMAAMAAHIEESRSKNKSWGSSGRG